MPRRRGFAIIRGSRVPSRAASCACGTLPHRPVMISPHPVPARRSRASHTDNTVNSSNITPIVPGLNHFGLNAVRGPTFDNGLNLTRAGRGARLIRPFRRFPAAAALFDSDWHLGRAARMLDPRLLCGSPVTAPSFSGLGHRPFTAAARVRIPLGSRNSITQQLNSMAL